MQDGSTRQVACRYPSEDLAWAERHAADLERPLSFVLRKALTEYRSTHDEEPATDGR